MPITVLSGWRSRHKKQLINTKRQNPNYLLLMAIWLPNCLLKSSRYHFIISCNLLTNIRRYFESQLCRNFEKQLATRTQGVIVRAVFSAKEKVAEGNKLPPRFHQCRVPRKMEALTFPSSNSKSILGLSLHTN